MNGHLERGRIMMVRWLRMAMVALMACTAASVGAQTTGPAEGGEMDPVAREALKLLQDRRGTLKDFQANVVYDVLHSKTEDREGKLGRVDYLMDPTVGPTFTVRFDKDTADGVPIKNHKQDLIFDGTNVTIVDHVGKTFTRRRVLPPGAKPGDATSLNGGMPLPIGVDVEEIAKNFQVTLIPGGGADQVTLKLVPKGDAVKQFDFKNMVMTVDKKLQLPVKVVRTERNGDVTTVELKDTELNTGKARMADASVPTGGDWTIDLGDK
jgi:hypothetical protein